MKTSAGPLYQFTSIPTGTNYTVVVFVPSSESLIKLERFSSMRFFQCLTLSGSGTLNINLQYKMLQKYVFKNFQCKLLTVLSTSYQTWFKLSKYQVLRVC